jgi:hypothetical protein
MKFHGIIIILGILSTNQCDRGLCALLTWDFFGQVLGCEEAMRGMAFFS